MDLSIIVSVSYSYMHYVQILEFRTHNSDKLNLDENKFVCKKKKFWKTSSPRYSDPKYARAGRNEESSRTTSWDNTETHFTIAGSARTDEFYERFRRISRSRIKLQWEIVLQFQSACNDSKFSFHAEPRQNACLLTHGIHRDYKKTNVLGNQFSRSDSRRDHPHQKENEDQSVPRATGTDIFSRGMTNKIEAQFQCRHLQEGRRLSSSIPVEIPQNSMVGQQRQQLQVPQSTIILMLENKIQKSNDCLFWFPAEAMLWIKEVEMVDSLEE